jgi:hypothetical protein
MEVIKLGSGLNRKSDLVFKCLDDHRLTLLDILL